jgi:hypothetical protein
VPTRFDRKIRVGFIALSPPDSVIARSDSDEQSRILRWIASLAIEIVAKAERHDTALAEKAVKLEFLERQIGEGGNEARFLGSVDHVRRIAETGRHRFGRGGSRWRKQRKLLVFHFLRGTITVSADRHSPPLRQMRRRVRRLPEPRRAARCALSRFVSNYVWRFTHGNEPVDRP